MAAADPITDFLAQETLAVVGVSSSEAKWGTRVYRDLKSKGYRVYGVNPRLAALDGERVYASLSDLPELPGGIVAVTPPAVTGQIVREAARLGIPRIWMQEGAESPEAIALAAELGLRCIHSTCVIVRSRR